MPRLGAEAKGRDGTQLWVRQSLQSQGISRMCLGFVVARPPCGERPLHCPERLSNDRVAEPDAIDAVTGQQLGEMADLSLL